MRSPIVIGSLIALLLSGFVPLSLADKDETPEMRTPDKRSRDSTVRETPFTISLKGSGERGDHAFTLEIRGEGVGKSRIKDDEVVKFKGRLLAHVILSDANGTVLREGDVRMKLQAMPLDDGTWKWHLETVGKRPRDLPTLVLRGQADSLAPGEYALDGHGKLVAKTDYEKRPVAIRFDVAGLLKK